MMTSERSASDNKPTTERASPDWERIEADYRAGVLSLREIATRGGVTEGAVRKHAKKHGWTRDLTARIRAKADELVRSEAVRIEGTQYATAYPPVEKAIVEANAQAIAAIRLAHRADISRARRLCLALIAELEAITSERPTVEQLREIVEAADAETDPKAIKLICAALDKAMSLPSRAGTLKQLSDALKTLVTLEREAWQVDSDKDGGHTYDDLLDEIHREGAFARPATTTQKSSIYEG